MRLAVVAAGGFLKTFLVLIMVVSLAVPGYSHPDFQIASETVVVGPGGFAEFPLSVHYHRIVGNFEVVDPVGGGVTLLLFDEQGFTDYAEGRADSRLYSSEENSKGSVNFLIPCCVERTYSEYHLVVDNTASSSPSSVRLHIELVHDDLAVIILDAEPSAAVLGGGLFGVFGVIISLSLVSAVRGSPNASVRERGSVRRVRLLSLAGSTILVAVFLLGFGVAALGVESYGGSLVEGFVAGVTRLSLPQGPFGSTLSVLVAVMVFPWIFAMILWTKSFGMAVGVGSRMVGVIGIVHGAGLFLIASILALTYESILLPILISGIVGLPQILGGAYLIQRS